MEKEKLIELRSVSKKYKDKLALNNINLTINKGDCIGIIGANGSGKSTISEIIGGIRKPTTGEVIRDNNMRIGVQFQESNYPIGITVVDMIKYYLESFNIEMTNAELVELMKTYEILGMGKKFVSSLSGGQQQRLNILLSVIHKPDLVILDEVSTGLDIEVREEIFNFLEENIVKQNRALILVSHTMSEIEKFCDKVIYMHNGEIIETKLVKDIIKDYGSVHEYMHQQFTTYKKADLQKQYNQEKEKISQSEKQIANQNKLATKVHNSKNISLLKLILKYYYRGFFVPFFMAIYPILILFLEGYAFKTSPNAINDVHNLVAGIAIVQVVCVGLFIIPQTIVEFKTSVLMKRIGATNIKPTFFILSVAVMGLLFTIISFLWTLLWTGIFFGTTYGWANIALPKMIGESIPFLLLVFISSITFGLLLSSLFKSTTSFMAVSNTVFMPIAFLSGSFVPITYIQNSSVLKYFSYVSPFKYCIEPFMSAWNGTFIFGVENIVYLVVSAALIVVYIAIASRKLKWQD